MPTPHGSRGGMAFSADELRVLRRALAIALQPTIVPARPGPERAAEVRDCLRLAEAVDAAVHEGGRMRAFLFEELVRYREALPGAALGYLDRLQDALAGGYLPRPEDLAALRRLSAAPVGADEAARRRALLVRCERLAEQHVRARLARRTGDSGGVRAWPLPWSRPAARTAGRRLRALPGGLADRSEGPGGHPARCATGEPDAPQQAPKPQPRKKPAAAPGRGQPDRETPNRGRPVPTPAEVFPPKRRPAPPAQSHLVYAAARTA
ncbi:hypothetical protein IHE55_13175 [Streptomyces pactum]|uniref:Uncharacterized protein n=2 Tax=Streptomyces pactum TaxID=68249 RepID=A0ABS0NKI8_9ACTN|nr:hypothetical protein [Streptomyces pactum]